MTDFLITGPRFDAAAVADWVDLTPEAALLVGRVYNVCGYLSELDGVASSAEVATTALSRAITALNGRNEEVVRLLMEAMRAVKSMEADHNFAVGCMDAMRHEAVECAGGEFQAKTLGNAWVASKGNEAA